MPPPPPASRAALQIKQAKLARELEASVSSEKALTSRVTELEEEVRDVSSTARGRIRWLEAQAEQTRRRMEQMFRELEGSVGLAVSGKPAASCPGGRAQGHAGTGWKACAPPA